MDTPPPLSLKSLLSRLARVVGKTPAALYERQRVLMEAGLLQTVGGRGPGSGVRATPQAMAVLLIALLATESVAEIGDRTPRVIKLKSTNKRCPITGKKTFGDALTAILASGQLANKIDFIEVNRSGETASARIVTKPDAFFGKQPISHFGSDKVASAAGMSTQVRLHLPLLAIANFLERDGDEGTE